jgi:hypothetical protein
MEESRLQQMDADEEGHISDVGDEDEDRGEERVRGSGGGRARGAAADGEVVDLDLGQQQEGSWSDEGSEGDEDDEDEEEESQEERSQGGQGGAALVSLSGCALHACDLSEHLWVVGGRDSLVRVYTADEDAALAAAQQVWRE